MNDLIFTAQPLRVRPHHLETPHSYLDRLCQANVIDRRLINTVIARRRAILGHRHQLPLVIHELGGPPGRHFARSYLTATPTASNDAETLLTAAYRRPSSTRQVCAHCAAGQPAATFDHRQFMTCLKHRRWLAPDHPAPLQRQIPAGGEWIAAERRYRRAATSGFLTPQLIDATWRIVRDQATVIGPANWTDQLHTAEGRPDFVDGVHDWLALFPHTATVLQLVSRSSTWHAVDVLCPNPEALRAELRRQLDWIPGPTWVIVEALAAELIRSRQSRLRDLRAMLARRHRPPHGEAL